MQQGNLQLTESNFISIAGNIETETTNVNLINSNFSLSGGLMEVQQTTVAIDQSDWQFGGGSLSILISPYLLYFTKFFTLYFDT